MKAARISWLNSFSTLYSNTNTPSCTFFLVSSSRFKVPLLNVRKNKEREKRTIGSKRGTQKQKPIEVDVHMVIIID
jgi:hypothetical protein